MNFADAQTLIIDEGAGEDGLVVDIRMGDIPDSARMGRLLEAMEVVYEGLDGQATLNRELANALFGLSFHIQGQVESWRSQGKEIREDFLDDEMVRLFLLVESIFEDEEMF